jgi:hypothetical protein
MGILIDAEELQDIAIQRIVKDIRKQQMFAGSLQYERLENDDFGPVYVTHRTIPHNMLVGKEAKFYVFVEEELDKDIVKRIYLIV